MSYSKITPVPYAVSCDKPVCGIEYTLLLLFAFLTATLKLYSEIIWNKNEIGNFVLEIYCFLWPTVYWRYRW